jgi:hypothetical protein
MESYCEANARAWSRFSAASRIAVDLALDHVREPFPLPSFAKPSPRTACNNFHASSSATSVVTSGTSGRTLPTFAKLSPARRFGIGAVLTTWSRLRELRAPEARRSASVSRRGPTRRRRLPPQGTCRCLDLELRQEAHSCWNWEVALGAEEANVGVGTATSTAPLFAGLSRLAAPGVSSRIAWPGCLGR